MYEISVKASFSAAHHLRGYAGSCASLHGHNWEVEVFVQGEALNGLGLLLDFRRLKQAVREELEALDHADLNSLEDFQAANPSSENLARYLYRRLSARLADGGRRVARVTVAETPGARASYWE